MNMPRVHSIFVQTSHKLNYQYRDEIKMYINNVHSAENSAAAKFPIVLWSCQKKPCEVCDGEGYEIVKCQRLDHRGYKNSQYTFKARCGVCFGYGVAQIDRAAGIDYPKQAAHLAAWQLTSERNAYVPST